MGARRPVGAQRLGERERPLWEPSDLVVVCLCPVQARFAPMPVGTSTCFLFAKIASHAMLVHRFTRAFKQYLVLTGTYERMIADEK